LVAKFPFASVDVEPATLLEVSQYRDTVTRAGKREPVTPMLVLGPPAAASSVMKA